MAHGALRELQERHSKGGHKAAAAACGGAGHYQVHHLLTCTANEPQLLLDKSEHLVWKDLKGHVCLRSRYAEKDACFSAMKLHFVVKQLAASTLLLACCQNSHT